MSTLGGFGAIVLWSSTIAVARSLTEQVGPLSAGACVYATGGVLCLAQRLWAKKAPGSTRLSRCYVWGCGSLFVAYTVLLYLAVGWAAGRAEALEIGLVNYLWPALTVLFSVPLLHKRAKAGLIPGTAMALGGVFLVLTQGSRISWQGFVNHVQANPGAYVAALAAAVSWALYSNLARRWAGAHGAVDRFIVATGVILLVLRLVCAEPGSWSARAAVEAAFLAAVTALAYGLWDWAMREGDLLLVAACSYLTPLFSTMLTCLYLQVAFSSRLWIGCGLVVAGSLLSWFSVREPASKPSTGREPPGSGSLHESPPIPNQ